MEDIYLYLRYTANLIAASSYGKMLVLKGGSVLISKLVECDRIDLYRLTSDLDVHCDKKEVWVEFCTNIENILNNNDAGYIYQIIKRRNTEKIIGMDDALTFSLNDNGRIVKFKIDMNIKSNRIITVEYSPLLNMQTYDSYTMLSDKVITVSSKYIFRRIKNLYDIAVLASIYSFNYGDVMQHIKIKHPNANIVNMLVYDNFSDIAHAYEKYEGITNKPDIRELITVCSSFLEPIYASNVKGDLTWNTQRLIWEKL